MIWRAPDMGREQQAAIDETQEQMRLLEESVDLHLKKAFRRQSILHHPDKVGDNAFTRQKYAQIQAVSRLPPPLAPKVGKTTSSSLFDAARWAPSSSGCDRCLFASFVRPTRP